MFDLYFIRYGAMLKHILDRGVVDVELMACQDVTILLSILPLANNAIIGCFSKVVLLIADCSLFTSTCALPCVTRQPKSLRWSQLVTRTSGSTHREHRTT